MTADDLTRHIETGRDMGAVVDSVMLSPQAAFDVWGRASAMGEWAADHGVTVHINSRCEVNTIYLYNSSDTNAQDAAA